MSKNTELAINTTKIPDVLTLLNAKLNDLKHITESNYVTSGNLDGFNNLKEEKEVENVIKMFSVILAKETAYTSAQEELGLTSAPVFKQNGSTKEEWKKDCILRVQIINHKEQYDKLVTMKKKAATFLSQEDQKEMFFKELQESFK